MDSLTWGGTTQANERGPPRGADPRCGPRVTSAPARHQRVGDVDGGCDRRDVGQRVAQRDCLPLGVDRGRRVVHHDDLVRVVGGVARFLVSVLFISQLGNGFPWGTLFVNVTGSFIIGFYAALTGPDGRLLASPRQRQFVMVGICGGYTTFSAFSLEMLRLVQSGDMQGALLNLGISVVGWLSAVWVGHALATRLNRLRGT